jgi:HEAT repeat protein
VDTSHKLLAALLGVALLAGFLYWSGGLGATLRFVKLAFDGLVLSGFRCWKVLLFWADWFRFFLLVIALVVLGQAIGSYFPFFGVLVGGALVFFGGITCLAFIRIDQERAEVGRGYKALHSPGQGQELAQDLLRYGSQVGVFLLVIATVGTILGFAQLNEGLYYSVGRNWYQVYDKQPDALDFGDFLAYTLFNLLRVLDLIDLLNSINRETIIQPEVRQALWPSKTLLAVFKTFFSLLLLQQIFSGLGRGRMLQQTVRDFWSPHPPIRERASDWLPLYGTEAVVPLFTSLRALDAVTAEQRAFLPRVIADIGPGSAPILIRHLHDANENARGVAVFALGMIRASQAVPYMILLADDPSDYVRQCLVQALGMVCVTADKPARPNSLHLELRPTARSWLARLLFRARQKSTRQIDPVPLSLVALRHALRDPSPMVRAEAAQSLGQVGPSAAPATAELIATLKDASDTVRCQAAESLSRVGGPATEVVNALVGQLADPNPALQLAVLRSLGALKQDAASATEALVPLLRASDEAVRQAAAEAIGQIGAMPPEALRQLTDALESGDNLVRAQTAEVLGNIGESAAAATPVLVEALADDNDRVRAKAAEALGKLGESATDAVPELVRALKDQDNWVSALAAEALGEIGAASDGPAPARVVSGLMRSLRHTNPHVREKAAESLGKLGNDARPALPGLERAAENDQETAVRRQAIWALGEAGSLSDSGTRIVLAAIEDPHPELRATALEALGKRAEPTDAVIASVVRALEDSNDLVQVEAARTLTRWADLRPAVVEGLCKLLRRGSPTVQAQAAQSLGKLGPGATSAGPTLLQATLQADEEVRENALRALALVQAPEAATAFRAGLTDPRAEIRKIASAGLMKLQTISEDAFPEVIQGLRDPESRVRANAAGILAKQKTLPDEAVPELLECLSDPEDAVRLNTALALRKAALPKLSAAFEPLLADPNPRVRLLAADLLLIGDPSHMQANQVVRESLADPAPRLRRMALELAGVLSAAVPELLEALRERVRVEEDPELSDLAAQLLEEAEKALSALPAPTS